MHGCGPSLREAAVERWGGERPTPHDLVMKSRVHPTYKTHYRVGNWLVYKALLHGCRPSRIGSAVGAAGMSAARGGMIVG